MIEFLTDFEVLLGPQRVDARQKIDGGVCCLQGVYRLLVMTGCAHGGSQDSGADDLRKYTGLGLPDKQRPKIDMLAIGAYFRPPFAVSSYGRGCFCWVVQRPALSDFS